MVASDRGARSGAGRSQRAKAWRPAQRLALSVRFIGGESTGSYTRRLADANGIPDEEFWPMFGAPARKGGCPSDPRYSDGYLNAAALERLAVMSGRRVSELQFALPNLRPHRLLTVEGAPVWDWPWDASGCFLVRVCELCASAKGTGLQSYLAADATWQVCARHGRWLDNRREPGTAAISLAALPEVVDAHRQRLLLERALGTGGHAMFADAYAITSLWWNIPSLSAPVWRARQQMLGRAGDDELRVAPLVFYPEAVRLAQALAAWERRRQRRTLTHDREQAWWAGAAAFLGEWGIPTGPGLDVLALWASRHRARPEPKRGGKARGSGARPAGGRLRRLPATAPHTERQLEAPLAQRSCLPWELGELLTTDLVPAEGGWTLNGRA